MKKLTILILGMGDMGKGIAQVCLLADFNVLVVDINEKNLLDGIEYVRNGIKNLDLKNKLPEGLTESKLLNQLSYSNDLYDTLKQNNIDLTIEAVIEKLELKQELCSKVLKLTHENSVFASNTSSIRISEIAETSENPENVIGMHFFNPAPLMRLIEVVKGNKTSEQCFQKGIEIAKLIPCIRGERYVASVLKDNPGFIVNRVLAPGNIYSNYIIDLAYEKGIPWEKVDADLSGPKAHMSSLTLRDFTGRDVAYHTQKYYAKKLSLDFEPGKVLTMHYERGDYGKKTGKGFYDWSNGRPNPILTKKANLVNKKIFIAISANEGCRILEEGVVSSWKVIDKAIIAGMNFPGPMQYATKNYTELVNLLEKTSKELNKPYLRPIDLFKSGEFIKMK